MSDDSKNREALLKRIVNKGRGVHTIHLERVLSFFSSPKSWDIVEKSAVVPGVKDPEGEKLIIGFDYLNQDICDLDFDATKTRGLIRFLKSITECRANSLRSSGIVRDQIHNNPPYDNLFRGLSPDVQILESGLPGGARIFYFIVGNKCNIVSIEARHRNID